MNGPQAPEAARVLAEEGRGCRVQLAVVYPGRDDVGHAGLHVALDGSPPLLQWPRLEEHITFKYRSIGCSNIRAILCYETEIGVFR